MRASANLAPAAAVDRAGPIREFEPSERPGVSFEHFFAHAEKHRRLQVPSKQRVTKAAEKGSDEAAETTVRKIDKLKDGNVTSQLHPDLVAATPPPPVDQRLDEAAEPQNTEGTEEMTSLVSVSTAGEVQASSQTTAPPSPGLLLPERNAQRDAAPIQASTAQPASTGIDSAQYAMQMKKSAKTGQSEQTLPNATPSTDTPAEMGVEEASPLQFWSKEFAIERATTPVSLAAYEQGTEIVSEPEPQMAASPEVRIAAVEAEIDRTIVHFRREGLDSLVVTVRPDADTQLRLRIAQDGDDILIAVKLERGELDVLRERWAGLQQELQQRGVILGRIESVAPSTTNLPGNPSEYSQSGSHSHQRNEAFPEAEESNAASEAQLKERLLRGRTSAMTLTVPDQLVSGARFESWA